MIEPSVQLIDSTFKSGVKMLEFTYGNGRYKFRISKVKAGLLKHNAVLINDFLDACDNDDWSKVHRHLPSTSATGGISSSKSITSSVRRGPLVPTPPGPRKPRPATVVKGSFDDVEKQVLEEAGIPVEEPKPAKKEHVTEIETTESTIVFK